MVRWWTGDSRWWTGDGPVGAHSLREQRGARHRSRRRRRTRCRTRRVGLARRVGRRRPDRDRACSSNARDGRRPHRPRSIGCWRCRSGCGHGSHRGDPAGGPSHRRSGTAPRRPLCRRTGWPPPAWIVRDQALVVGDGRQRGHVVARRPRPAASTARAGHRPCAGPAAVAGDVDAGPAKAGDAVDWAVGARAGTARPRPRTRRCGPDHARLARAHALERQQFGRPIAHLPGGPPPPGREPGGPRGRGGAPRRRRGRAVPRDGRDGQGLGRAGPAAPLPATASRSWPASASPRSIPSTASSGAPWCWTSSSEPAACSPGISGSDVLARTGTPHRLRPLNRADLSVTRATRNTGPQRPRGRARLC